MFRKKRTEPRAVEKSSEDFWPLVSDKDKDQQLISDGSSSREEQPLTSETSSSSDREFRRQRRIDAVLDFVFDGGIKAVGGALLTPVMLIYGGYRVVKSFDSVPPYDPVSTTCVKSEQAAVEACSDVYEFNGHYMVRNYMRTTDHPKGGRGRGFTERAMRMDDSAMVHPDGSRVNGYHNENGEVVEAHELSSSVWSNRCLAKGETVQGRFTGGYFYKGVWHPINVTSEPITATGECGDNGWDGIGPAPTANRIVTVTDGKLDLHSVDEAMRDTHYVHGEGVVPDPPARAPRSLGLDFSFGL